MKRHAVALLAMAALAAPFAWADPGVTPKRVLLGQEGNQSRDQIGKITHVAGGRVLGAQVAQNGEGQFRQRTQPFAAYVGAQNAKRSAPRMKPTAVNTLGPLIKDRSTGPATAL